MSREPISVKLVADLLSTAGADRAISVDLHLGGDPGGTSTARSTT